MLGIVVREELISVFAILAVLRGQWCGALKVRGRLQQVVTKTTWLVSEEAESSVALERRVAGSKLCVS